MVTQYRVRQKTFSDKKERVNPFSIYYTATCDKYPNNPYIAQSYDYSTLLSTGSFTDEICLLPSDYEAREAFKKTPEYLAWTRSFKNCTHVKTFKYITLPSVTTYNNKWPHRCGGPSTPLYNGLATVTGQPVADLYSYNNSDFNRPYSGVAVAMDSVLYNDFITITKTDYAEMAHRLLSDSKLLGSKTFSLANFIYELKEVSNLVSVFKTKLLSFAGVGNANLAYQFGIAPLMGDIQAIYDVVLNLRRRIKAWNSQIGKTKIYNSHITYRTINETVSANPEFSLYSNKIEYQIVGKIRAHAYFEPQYISELDTEKLFTKFLGLNAPISIVWQALPFSFLVDWVVSVGDMIDTYENSNNLVQVRSPVIGYSVKIEIKSSNSYTFKAWPDPWSDGTFARPSGPHGIRLDTYSLFQRTRVPAKDIPAIRPVDSLAFTPVQSANHIGLAASLVFTRR